MSEHDMSYRGSEQKKLGKYEVTHRVQLTVAELAQVLGCRTKGGNVRAIVLTLGNGSEESLATQITVTWTEEP